MLKAISGAIILHVGHIVVTAQQSLTGAGEDMFATSNAFLDLYVVDWCENSTECNFTSANV